MADQPIKKNAAFTFYIPGLVSQSNTKIFQSNPTIASGDFQISKDGAAFANIGTLPDVEPNSTTQVRVILTADEMNADQINIRWIDASGAEWCDGAMMIFTSTYQTADLLRPATAGRTLDVDASGKVILQATQTGVTIPTVTTLTNDPSGVTTLLARIASALTITAGKVDVNDKTGFSLLTADKNTLVDLIWDELLSGHVTAGSSGKELADAGAAGTPPTVTEIAAAMVTVLTQLGIPSNAGLNKYVRRGDLWEISITGLGDLTNVDDIYFTAKARAHLNEADDNNAMVQVQQSTGLVRFNKEDASASAADASIAIVGDPADGAILVSVSSAQTTDAPLGMFDFDVQLVTNNEPTTPEAGMAQLFVSADVTRA